MSFSIDDVRETFTADATSIIARLRAAAESLLAAPGLAVPEADETGRPPFVALGELGHSLAGTTALVGAESLATSAHLLEDAARAGQESLRLAELHASRARALAALCLDGATQMREMLRLELDRRPEEAVGLSHEWRARAAAAGTALGLAAAASDGAAGAGAGGRAAPAGEALHTREGHGAGPGPGAGVDAELLEVFQDEARAALGELEEKLALLRREPRDFTAAAELERLYHTLEGAAATVALTEVSARAARLVQRLDAVLDEGVGASPEVVDEIWDATNEMLTLAGLAPLALPSPSVAGASPALFEAKRLFVEECAALRGEAAGLARRLRDPAAGDAEGTRSDLARLFHRLKGSALIVEEAEIAVAAERAQQLLEAADEIPQPAAELAAEAEGALALLGAFLERAGVGQASSVSLAAPGAASARPPAREPVDVQTEGELWEAMQLECNELSEQLEREGLALEDSAQPKTNLQTLLRHVHTLKGVVNTIGLHPTGRLLHAIEDFLEKLLEAPILPPMRKVASLVLDARDGVRRNIAGAVEGSVEVLLPRFEQRIARLLGARPPAASSALLVSGTEDGASIHDLEEMRSRRSVASGAAPGGPRDAADAMDRRFIRVATERLDNLMNLAGELVVSRSRLLARAASLRQIQQELGWGSRRLLEAVDSFREEYEFSNLDGKKVRRKAAQKVVAQRRRAAQQGGAWSAFGELELDRYEDIHVLARTLTEITSDVVESNGQLERGLGSLADDSDSFHKLVSGIQSEVTRARMVTLEVLFTRLKLPVRDAATRESKEVRVAAEGVDVALDKTIADALFQPMLHLVRNAVVHGIESTGRRERAGKPRTGTITLSARQHAGQIAVEVRDDGAGLDLPALRARGLAMGVIGADVPLDDPAVRELVFHPGLSTSARAGAVAGRGVGCDVVRRAVERLGGSIRVEHEPGRGAAFLITLPVSLAIAKALLVRAGGRSYAIPLHFAERMVDAVEAVFVESAGVRRVKVDDQLVPVSSLERHFAADAPARRGRAVILLRVGDHRLALEVDEVTGQEEVVVKSLGPFLAGHPLFAGITIRGSGELVLILDVAGFLQNAQRTQARRPGRALEPGRPGARAPAPPVHPEPAPSAKLPLRVLFIDDSLSVRKFAEMTLKALGTEVTVALDGADGLTKLRAGTFDLVFTDLEMPRMHGFELISELRFLPAYKDLPIIVVTSRSGQKHQQQARALGATDYLTKPFSVQMLDAALRRWGTRRAGAPPSAGAEPPETDAR
jgi:chemosensory pili system protein ChpA (sensor histidine kinase/response regulator)